MLSNGHFLLFLFLFSILFSFFFHLSFVLFTLLFCTRYCNFSNTSFVLRYFFFCVPITYPWFFVPWYIMEDFVLIHLRIFTLLFWWSVPHFLLYLNGTAVQVIYTVISVVYVFIIYMSSTFVNTFLKIILSFFYFIPQSTNFDNFRLF